VIPGVNLSYFLLTSHRDGSTGVSLHQREAPMISALQGALLQKTKGTAVTYVPVCSVCGTVQNRTVFIHVFPGTALSTAFRCSRCGHDQPVTIENKWTGKKAEASSSH
jgi:hypothetical protein